MVDIEKFKAELTAMKAEKETARVDGIQHAKTILEPVFQVAAAAENVFPGKITIREPRPDGYAFATTIDVDGVRVEFLTQPSSGMLTIKGMDKELAQVIPPSEKPRGLPAMVRDQISPSRSIKLEELDHAATAFAAFVRNQLAAGAS